METERVARHELIVELIHFYAYALIDPADARHDTVVRVLARAWVLTHGGGSDRAMEIVKTRARLYLER